MSREKNTLVDWLIIIVISLWLWLFPSFDLSPSDLIREKPFKYFLIFLVLLALVYLGLSLLCALLNWFGPWFASLEIHLWPF